jgi:hypothetical protein
LCGHILVRVTPMKLEYSSWLKKTWPLALSVLALSGIARLLPQMYWDFEFSRNGVPVTARYTDLNQDGDFFHYAYAVGNVTYAGRASWGDADSNIHSHKPGDEFPGVQYLSTKPWWSVCRRNPETELREARTWVVCNLCIFFFGIWLYKFRSRKRFSRKVRAILYGLLAGFAAVVVFTIASFSLGLVAYYGFLPGVIVGVAVCWKVCRSNLRRAPIS